MSIGVSVPREMAMRKPAHGHSCTSCGLCCYMSLCDLAVSVFRKHKLDGPCPALQLDAAGSSSCGLVTESPEPYRAAALLLTRAGEGCDCRINGEPVNTAFHARQDANDAANRDDIKKAWQLWKLA